MAQNDTANIKNAVGIHSVYLAVLKDKKLVGRYFHMEGEFLLYKDGRKVTKRQLADVMVYMAGKYNQNLTLEDVELGLLAAAREYGELAGQDVQEVSEPLTMTNPVKDVPDVFIDEEPDDEAAVEMDSPVVEDEDWVTDDYSDKPSNELPAKGKPGVKPDTVMIEAMTTGENRLTPDDIHISTLELALRFYDFIANDLARPETDKGVQHKVKLALGSTMKALGWKKRMRKGVYGWVPADDSYFDGETTTVNPDNVILRKRDAFVEPAPEPPAKVDTVESLPKLSEREVHDGKSGEQQLDPDDDLPWPETNEMSDFTDGSPERKKEKVRFINLIEGTEEEDIRELVYGSTMTFFLDDNGIERMVEWDKDEGAWTFYIEEKAV